MLIIYLGKEKEEKCNSLVVLLIWRVNVAIVLVKYFDWFVVVVSGVAVEVNVVIVAVVVVVVVVEEIVEVTVVFFDSEAESGREREWMRQSIANDPFLPSTL